MAYTTNNQNIEGIGGGLLTLVDFFLKERLEAFYWRVWCLSSSLPKGFPLKSSSKGRRSLGKKYFNHSTSKSVWQDLKETTRSFQSQLSSVERHLGNIGRRLEQREHEHAMGGYLKIMDIKHILKRYSYMEDGYGHLYPYEQEASKTEARKTCAQKKVKFEEQLRKVGVMSNEHIGKKTSIGEPRGPWRKKSKNEEIKRSQEVMLDKNDTCEWKKVMKDENEWKKERELSFQYYPFLEYPLMLGDATGDNSCDNTLYDSRMNDYYSYVANVDSFVLGVENKEERILGVLENKGKSLRKKLLNLQEETTMSFSLDPSPLYYDFSFKDLNLLLESYSFHMSICGNACESIVVLESEDCWGGSFKVSKIFHENVSFEFHCPFKDSWGFTIQDILKEDDPYNLISNLLKEYGKDWRLSIGGFGAYHQVCQRGFLSNPSKGEDHWERNEFNHPSR
ncbi:hypothetical protein M9H77_03047 [Catharanthus roseus]|uniref:Uncharacterized protein n=1 Tax=Catharanthus roseus TaxID=4058 RepID=A0ACC0CAA7_CATRO|nr:hypothetical protein M9H77_03047 [Catharanthus roseus]